MTARTRHLVRDAADLFDGSDSAALAADVICGTEPKQGHTLWATATASEVTCKRCLKVMADINAEAAADRPEAPKPVFKTQAISRETLYTADAYLAPTGPFIESVHDIIIPTDFDDKSIAQRHGLERFEVENAINDGILVR